jgi:hypothetical protein
VTFADLAAHYMKYELGEQTESVSPKAHTTIGAYLRVLRNRLLPRWGDHVALSVEPLEIENWLRAVKREDGLENPTLDKIRRVMSLVYKHAQRYGLIPRNQESNRLIFVRCKTQSDYEAIILTPSKPSQFCCISRNRSALWRCWLLVRDCELRSAWACNGAMSASRNR